MIKKKKIILNNFFLLLSVCFFVICTISLAANDFTFFIFNFIVINVLLISCILTKKYNTHFLFLFFFLIYTLSSLFVYYSQIFQFEVPGYYADEQSFYNVSYYFIYDERPSWIISKNIKDIDRIEWYLYFLLLAKLGELFNIVNENSFLALKQTSVIFGAFSVVYVYKLYFHILKDHKASYNLSIIFGILPYTILNSSVLMRDIVILFFTKIIILKTFYFIFGSKLSFAKLIIGLIAIYFLRVENALLMCVIVLSLILIHVWKKKYYYQNNKIFLFLIIFILFCLNINNIYDELIFRAFITIQDYSKTTLEYADSNSFGSLLFSLPFPLNIFSRFLFSQINPFPIWGEVQHNFALIVEMLGGLIWFPILILSFITILIKKYRDQLGFKLLILYLITVVYLIILSYVAADPRRLIAFYPIILLIAYYSYYNFSLVFRRLYFLFSIFFMIFLHGVYIILKI